MKINDKCLATLLIGETYQKMWRQHFEKSWREYAKKHGYDIVVVDRHIDGSERGRNRTPHWQKCLILEHEEVRQYKDVVWVDADVVINFHTAPCIVGCNEPGKIGIVSYNAAYPNAEKKDNILGRAFEYGPQEWMRDPGLTYPMLYAKAGLATDVDDMVNTGVLVLRTGVHEELLRQVYDHCEENEFSAKENIPLSYHILASGMANAIDTRFNTIWDYVLLESYPFLVVENFETDLRMQALCVNTAWHNSYFLHFIAGNSRRHAAYLVQDHHWIDAWRRIYEIH